MHLSNDVISLRHYNKRNSHSLTGVSMTLALYNGVTTVVDVGQIPVDQLAPLEHPAHDGDGLHVRLAQSPLAEAGVADAGAGPSVPSEKFHNEDVAFQ